MRNLVLPLTFSFSLFLSTPGHAEDNAKLVQSAVRKSTLDQPGTAPFHLKAQLAPSRERDKDSGRTGTVEIWWQSPAKWRREVRSPDFHQIEIVNGEHEWENNEGEYFPEWLRNIAVELVEPVPNLPMVLERVKTADVRKIISQINIEWEKQNGSGAAQKNARGYIAIENNSGLLFYGGGLGWGGMFQDYALFHGRMIAKKVSAGSPEVTAQVVTLEDLSQVPDNFFEAKTAGSDPRIRTVFLDQDEVMRSSLPGQAIVWPTLQDGSLEGGVTTDLVIDRSGNVRGVGSVVSENSGVNDVGRKAFEAMRFKPFLVSGEPVQVVTRFTIPFKTTRPAGTEAFDSAKNYFENARKLDFPAAGAGSPYVLRAEFESGTKSGKAEKGQYQDNWLSDTQWRREASIGSSHLVRTRSGDKYYVEADGEDAPVLRIVLKVMEPIPAIDTFVESDWRIKRDRVDDHAAIRVLTGAESPDGNLDPEHARGYWFDSSGNLVKVYFAGLEVKRSNAVDFSGVHVARRVEVFHGGKLGMVITVEGIDNAGATDPQIFVLKKHEWKRAFTDEVR